MPIKTYHDLDVFREAYDAALAVSKLTRTFPAVEQFELARQLRRAARSVPANIAEGWAKRNSTAEFKSYLQVAMGSCHEVKFWLDMSRDEGYVSVAEIDELKGRYDRIGAMLYGLWKNWRRIDR
ncbi:MAG: four helix bundle protein [Acidobacteria bacterium]|nr:four helix bundle protein [Acidobacteriota bacterium]